ncbi:MAG: aminopeptidase [Cyclobacteriaceae bacterium]
MKRKWKVVLVLAVAVVALVVIYADLLEYGIGQARGQLRVIMDAQPIEVYLNDPDFPDSLKAKVRIIEEVKAFAIEELGLNRSDNYTSIYDQEGREILWNVSAADEFELKPFEWSFPIVGTFSYKGFFEKDKAIAERARLDSLGYDTNIRNVNAWSTLGWFRDPILSNMLYRSEGQLAELIIHELTHATVFVTDSLTFNENLASFVGSIGAEAYLKKKYGVNSEELRFYKASENDYEMYLSHMIRGSKELEQLYRATEGMDVENRRRLKQEKIREIVHTLDTVSFYQPQRFNRVFQDRLPNNANLMSYLRYHSQRDLLADQYLDNFEGDIKAYILYLKEKYGV